MYIYNLQTIHYKTTEKYYSKVGIFTTYKLFAQLDLKNKISWS